MMSRTSTGPLPLLLAFTLASCSRETKTHEAPVPTPTVEPPAPTSTQTTAPNPASQTPCGPMACLRFPSAEKALDHILERDPEVIAVGEAHALAGTDGIPTATERFEKELLPLLARRGATELVVELLKPAEGCKKTVAEVRKKQEPVVEKQSAGNQNRFIQLGHASKELGVTPYILEPSCDEYAGVVQGGPDGIVRMLELIAEKTEGRVLRFWQRNRLRSGQTPEPAPAADAPTAPGKPSPEQPANSEPATAVAPSPPSKNTIVVAYGGAMHNDVEISEDKAAFSFGRSLVEKTGGKYVALDLIVPEYIKPTDTWKALPWYQHFDAENPPDDVTLFRVDEHSYVLIFGKSDTPATPAEPGEPNPTEGRPAESARQRTVDE